MRIFFFPFFLKLTLGNNIVVPGEKHNFEIITLILIDLERQEAYC